MYGLLALRLLIILGGGGVIVHALVELGGQNNSFYAVVHRFLVRTNPGSNVSNV